MRYPLEHEKSQSFFQTLVFWLVTDGLTDADCDHKLLLQNHNSLWCKTVKLQFDRMGKRVLKIPKLSDITLER